MPPIERWSLPASIDRRALLAHIDAVKVANDYDRLTARVAELEAVLREATSLPELNMSNYNDDDVAELNDRATAVVLLSRVALRSSAATSGGEK